MEIFKYDTRVGFSETNGVPSFIALHYSGAFHWEWRQLVLWLPRFRSRLLWYVLPLSYSRHSLPPGMLSRSSCPRRNIPVPGGKLRKRSGISSRFNRSPPAARLPDVSRREIQASIEDLDKLAHKTRSEQGTRAREAPRGHRATRWLLKCSGLLRLDHKRTLTSLHSSGRTFPGRQLHCDQSTA